MPALAFTLPFCLIVVTIALTLALRSITPEAVYDDLEEDER